jgi:hypothetical protein
MADAIPICYEERSGVGVAQRELLAQKPRSEAAPESPPWPLSPELDTQAIQAMAAAEERSTINIDERRELEPQPCQILKVAPT